MGWSVVVEGLDPQRHSAAWTASDRSTPCLRALGWTFTQAGVRVRP